MATLYAPRIVTDGLVLCLDAGNRKSYPGSGTSWVDMSGNNNTGTLTNGPTFGGGNGGSIVFDGVNDFVNFSNYLWSYGVLLFLLIVLELIFICVSTNNLIILLIIVSGLSITAYILIAFERTYIAR